MHVAHFYNKTSEFMKHKLYISYYFIQQDSQVVPNSYHPQFMNGEKTLSSIHEIV